MMSLARVLGVQILACIYICRLIFHTNSLMDGDENLCIEVLRALQQMLEKESDFGEKVREISHYACKLIYTKQKTIGTVLSL